MRLLPKSVSPTFSSLTVTALLVCGIFQASASIAVAAPTIKQAPEAQTVLLGTWPSYVVVATGSGDLKYQWDKNGQPIAGATDAILHGAAATQADNSAQYTVTVTDSTGATTSKTVGLKVVMPADDKAPQLPNIPANVFDITKNGAVADGHTDNTLAIEKTIAEATAAGGGIVQIPPAEQPYMTGPFELANSINFYVAKGAELQILPKTAAGNVAAYPGTGTAPGSGRSVIGAPMGAHDIAMTGGGHIDGQGVTWWRGGGGRPYLVRIAGNQILIDGLTFSNPPMFHVGLSQCNNLTVFGVIVRAPENSPNTDGVDPSGSHILIQNCDISCGDDNIAVKAGSAFCTDLVIADCTFGTGHGVSVGGQSNRGLDGMIVKNCTFNGTTSGLRLKADPTQGGPSQNISYHDITMNNVQYPICFYSYYRSVGSPGSTSGNTQSTIAKVKMWNSQPPNRLDTQTMPSWKNITIDNLTATNTRAYNIIYGLPREGFYIDNVVLHNVHISGGPGMEIYDATNIQFTGDTDVGKLLTFNSMAIVQQPADQSAAPGGSASFFRQGRR